MLNLSLFKHVVIAAAVLLPACFANAHEYKSGDLEIAHPWSQELPPYAPTVAAYFIIHNTGSVKAACTGVDQMEDTIVLFCNAFQVISCNTFHSIYTPVCTNICEHLSTSCKEFHEQHS